MAIAIYAGCNAWNYYKSGYISGIDAIGCAARNYYGGPRVNHAVMIVGHETMTKSSCRTANAYENYSRECYTYQFTWYAATATTPG